MWRRTRNTNTPTNCVGLAEKFLIFPKNFSRFFNFETLKPRTGTDPNRNWDAHWATVGASSNPCSDTYHGPSAFSEVETKKLSEFILSVGEAQGYADVHAYSKGHNLNKFSYIISRFSNFVTLSSANIGCFHTVIKELILRRIANL